MGYGWTPRKHEPFRSRRGPIGEFLGRERGDDQRRLVTTGEAALILGVSAYTVRRLVKRGKLIPICLGEQGEGHHRFEREDVERLIASSIYFWKSAKWGRGLQLRTSDGPGFGGQRHHNYGDPWRDEALHPFPWTTRRRRL